MSHLSAPLMTHREYRDALHAVRDWKLDNPTQRLEDAPECVRLAFAAIEGESERMEALLAQHAPREDA